MLTKLERTYSSCLRELLGYAHAIRTLVQTAHGGLRGLVVQIVGDSKAASFVFAKGASQAGYNPDTDELMVFEALMDLLAAAEEGDFAVVFRWVSRKLIKGADELSKVLDAGDFGLRPDAFAHVMRELGGPCDVDRFAAGHNRVCARFNAKYDTLGAEAADAFSVSWAAGLSYILPEFREVDIDKVLDKIERDNAAVVLVLPVWRRSPFWHRICSTRFRQRVAGTVGLSGSCLVAHAEHANECFFHEWEVVTEGGRRRRTGRRCASGMFNSPLLALRTRALQPEELAVAVHVVAASSSNAPKSEYMPRPATGSKKRSAPETETIGNGQSDGQRKRLGRRQSRRRAKAAARVVFES